jgi:hypothetical protein
MTRRIAKHARVRTRIRARPRARTAPAHLRAGAISPPPVFSDARTRLHAEGPADGSGSGGLCELRPITAAARDALRGELLRARMEREAADGSADARADGAH